MNPGFLAPESVLLSPVHCVYSLKNWSEAMAGGTFYFGGGGG